MIRFLGNTTLSGYLYGKGTVASFDKSVEDILITLESAEAYDPDGFHPYYHFHGFTGKQVTDDEKFYDLTGINHASRGVNLSVAQLWTPNSGYASTVDPATGATDSVLRIPNLNYDYAGGEKLIIWWLGKVTAETIPTPMMGDGYGTSPGQRGINILLQTNGRVGFVLSGATEVYSSNGHKSISGGLHSFGIAISGGGQGGQHGIWVDEEYSLSEGSYTPLTGGIDTRNSNTFNIGTSYPAPARSSSGIATATRALVILRLPASYPMPSVKTLTSVFQQLRSNPGNPILRSAF
ncbi:hypothetical protein [Nitrosospira multiformis]|uniref:hypothetical protein n=1 Tax=Nitrosospira multiformis TaxID=1231 RepID=UPI00089B1321|nr:hypothetical protein [Nitrosospira multiformis]SDZ86124.1 hypothetical protein SAMN05216411_102169 [Nitrosospira multiformis]